MPDFTYDHKVYYNPVEFALHFIGGTWKMPILWRINKATMRYTDLKKTLPHISHKMLSSQLRELEKYGFLSRKVYAVVPPKVEYSITEKGKMILPVINAIKGLGETLMKEEGIKLHKRTSRKTSG